MQSLGSKTHFDVMPLVYSTAVPDSHPEATKCEGTVAYSNYMILFRNIIKYLAELGLDWGKA